MNRFLVLFGILLLPSLLSAQKDSIFVVNAFDYDITYGISMFHKFCSNQKTFKLNGPLEKEVNFVSVDEKTTKIDTYVYYYYNQSGQITSKETVSEKGSLLRSSNYIYNNKKQKVLEISFLVENNSPRLLGYKKLNHITSNEYSYTEYNAKKKKTSTGTVEKTTDTFKETTTYRKPANNNNILSKTIERTYTNGRVTSETETTNYSNGNNCIKTQKNIYNNFGLLYQKEFFLNDSLTHQQTLKYYPSGFKKSMKEKDGNDKLSGYVGYEIHKYFKEYNKPASISEQYIPKLKIKIPK